MMPIISSEQAEPCEATQGRQCQERGGVESKEERRGVLLGVTLLLVITCSRCQGGRLGGLIDGDKVKS